MSAILGLRGTGEFSTDFRPTNFRELFTLLEPNGTAPLNALLSMASSSETDDPKFNHFRDELPNRVLTADAAAAAGVATITVEASGDESFVVAGTLLSNVRTGEVMRATANANTTNHTIAVSRNVGGTSADVADGDKLVIIGFADKEGGNAPDPVSFDPTTDFNYTQIFKTAVSLTDTLKNTYLRTGSKEQEMLTKGLKLHMSDIERAMFFGRRAIENANSSQPTRYTGGLLASINNVVDGATAGATAGTLTEKEFDRILVESVFAYGSKEKVAFIGPKVAANLQEIGKNRWQPTTVNGAYGVSMTRYATFAGDLMIHVHPMFRQIPGMESSMIILDVPYVSYRYMKGRDTSLKRNVQAPDTDGSKHYYLTECGLELTQSKVHTYLKNWTKV